MTPLRKCALLLTLCTATTSGFAQTLQCGDSIAAQIRAEALRCWKAYVQYAWGKDDFYPLSKKGKNWYAEPVGITLIDAYSTLKLMKFDDEAARIEHYVADSISFDKNVFAKTFEVDIRILGGLLCMYHLSHNPAILRQAEDFGRRLLPAFETSTGIPRYYVNLKTGASRGDTVNAAEGGSSMLEMGILSAFTGNPVYYQKAKRATKALFERRSRIGLVGQDINVTTGKWLGTESHIGACIDSYYEYQYKAWVLFGDPELKAMWDSSITAVNRYVADESGPTLWYGKVDRETGAPLAQTVTLWDAYFPALLVLSEDIPRASRLQLSWDRLWNRYGLEPMVYDYKKDSVLVSAYGLNPEIIESAYYLFNATHDPQYRQMVGRYFSAIESHCRTDLACATIKNVATMEQADEMPSFFFAETLKYLYLTFVDPTGFTFADIVFTTEGHPFRRAAFRHEEMRKRLGW